MTFIFFGELLSETDELYETCISCLPVMMLLMIVIIDHRT